jgi:hypothetical protein
VTYGSARWADARVLRDLKLALKKDEVLPPFTLLLGGLGWKHSVVLGPEHSTCHLAMFGPPRSGKSSTFFITWQQAWAGTGSVIVLDPKGELYEQTAYLFRNVYRIDLQTPERCGPLELSARLRRQRGVRAQGRLNDSGFGTAVGARRLTRFGKKPRKPS